MTLGQVKDFDFNGETGMRDLMQVHNSFSKSGRRPTNMNAELIEGPITRYNVRIMEILAREIRAFLHVEAIVLSENDCSHLIVVRTGLMPQEEDEVVN